MILRLGRDRDPGSSKSKMLKLLYYVINIKST